MIKKILSFLLLFFLLIISLTTSYIAAGAVKYTYDDAGRLAEADYGDKRITYTYDKAGNLLERMIIGKASTPVPTVTPVPTITPGITTKPTPSIVQTLTEPPFTTVLRGWTLGPFTLMHENTGDASSEYDLYAYITQPDGTTWEYGPVSMTLDAGRIWTYTGYLRVGYRAPFGTYALGFKITDKDGGLIDGDSFDFDVVPPFIILMSEDQNKEVSGEMERLREKRTTRSLKKGKWEIVIGQGE